MGSGLHVHPKIAGISLAATKAAAINAVSVLARQLIEYDSQESAPGSSILADRFIKADSAVELIPLYSLTSAYRNKEMAEKAIRLALRGDDGPNGFKGLMERQAYDAAVAKHLMDASERVGKWLSIANVGVGRLTPDQRRAFSAFALSKRTDCIPYSAAEIAFCQQALSDPQFRKKGGRFDRTLLQTNLERVSGHKRSFLSIWRLMDKLHKKANCEA